MRIYAFISAAVLVAGVLIMIWNPFVLFVLGIIIIVLNYIIFGSDEPYLSMNYYNQAYVENDHGIEQYEREEDYDDIEVANPSIIDDSDFFYVIGILYIFGGVVYLIYFAPN